VWSFDGDQQAAASLAEFLAAQPDAFLRAVELGSCLPQGLIRASSFKLKEEAR
jgi:hypothetical protein